ncbi:MAG: RNA polymerase factor sigma-54 [Acetobacter papayae]
MVVALGHKVGQNQRLSLTPGMKESLQLLKMPLPALLDFIDQKIAANPFLDWKDGAPPSVLTRLSGFAQDAADTLEAQPPSTAYSLLHQLAAQHATELEQRCALAILDALDEQGRLPIPPAEVARNAHLPPGLLEQVRQRLLRLEPCGVAARSLEECLHVQLEEQGEAHPDMLAVLAHLPLLASRGAAHLASVAGLPVQTVKDLLARLRGLDPFPWRQAEGAQPAGIRPELIASKTETGTWAITLPDTPEEAIRFETALITRIRRTPHARTPPADTQDMTAHWQAQARWLMRALPRRSRSLLAVARHVLHYQAASLEHGPQALRPLSMVQVARALRLNDSTISRIVANKYVQTPRGTLPLRAFFSAALGADTDTAQASGAARACLLHLLESETAHRVRSDQDYAEALRQHGFSLSRRTVVKYRRMLGIPSSFERMQAWRAETVRSA